MIESNLDEIIDVKDVTCSRGTQLLSLKAQISLASVLSYKSAFLQDGLRLARCSSMLAVRDNDIVDVD